MLRTEQNTFSMARKIVKAANKHFRCRQMVAVFEHGHWWVEHRKTGEQWSVIDAEGISTTNGFSFEQVSFLNQ